MLRFLALLAPLLVLTVSSSAGVLGQQNFEYAKKQYEESLTHPDFYHRARGIDLFANCMDIKALEILRQRYFEPDDPNPHTAYKYFIAGACGTDFRQAQHLEEWRSWREQADEELDCWQHYFAWQIEALHGDVTRAIEVIKDPKQPGVFRASALEALTAVKAKETLPLVIELLNDSKLLGKRLSRGMVVEACASAVLAFKDSGSKEFEDALTALIEQVDERKNPDRSAIVIARRLSKIFETDDLYMKSSEWETIRNGEDASSRTSGKRKRYRKPEFFGVESSGERIVFIVDMSDSMLTPLTYEELEDIKKKVSKKKVYSGHGAQDAQEEADKEAQAEQEKREQEEAQRELEALLPWDKIKTRFDAAREATILALNNLESDMYFSVVSIGTYATWFNATPGLVPASSSNVHKAVAELNKITPIMTGRSPGKSDQLRGTTNIHGAFLKAYRSLRGTTYDGEDEHSAETCFTSSVQTIFLLTDGEATADDYTEQSKIREIKPGKWRDPETGELHEGSGSPHYPVRGPYRIPKYYLMDILRMNLLRKAEIHTVGIGEADYESLQAISDIGLGTFTRIGQNTDDPAPRSKKQQGR